MSSTLFKHTVLFEREVRGRTHRFRYSMPCRLHSDIYEKILERALRRNVLSDMDSLIDSAVEKTDGFSLYTGSSGNVLLRDRIF